MSQKPLLKQFGDLTAADFAAHPIWISVYSADYDEPWYEDSDEETFRPWTGDLPIGPEEGMSLVRATLTLADGRSFTGFLTPGFDDEPIDIAMVQPYLFLPSGPLYGFWDGMFKRAEEDRQTLYTEFGNDPNAIFPIHFAAAPELATGHTSGKIAGFYWLEDDEPLVYV